MRIEKIYENGDVVQRVELFNVIMGSCDYYRAKFSHYKFEKGKMIDSSLDLNLLFKCIRECKKVIVYTDETFSFIMNMRFNDEEDIYGFGVCSDGAGCKEITLIVDWARMIKMNKEK